MMTTRTKCKCGNPITRTDREVCDECWHTGEERGPVECVVEYYLHNNHKRPEGVIGMSLNDLEPRGVVVSPCCEEMRKEFNYTVYLAMKGWGVGIKFVPMKGLDSVQAMAARLANKGQWIDRCNFCGRPIRLVRK
jgi:hypothetical protein